MVNEIFWSQDAERGEGGIYYRCEIGVFIEELEEKGYKVVGIKLDHNDIRNVEVLVEDVRERNEDVE
jgi:nucleoside diphosphate kinase